MKTAILVLLLVSAASVFAGTASAATVVTVKAENVTPTAVMIFWTDESGCTSYTLQQGSSVDGPWATLSIPYYLNSYPHYYWSLVQGLTPSMANWYRVICRDSSGNTAYSEPLSVTQLPAASLTISRPSPTTARLSWTNSVTYLLSNLNGPSTLCFDAYQVFQNGTLLVTITSKDTTTYLLQNLSPGKFQFQVRTDDRYKVGYNCGGTSGTVAVVSSMSNEAYLSPPLPSFVWVPNGLTVTFTPSVSGGVGPYTYVWNYGDGSGTSRTTSHTYSAEGNYTVILYVEDSGNWNGTVSQLVQVTASPTPPPSNPDASGPLENPLVWVVAVVAAVAVILVFVLRRRH